MKFKIASLCRSRLQGDHSPNSTLPANQALPQHRSAHCISVPASRHNAFGFCGHNDLVKSLVITVAAIISSVVANPANGAVQLTNVVGFITLPLAAGANLVANQLDADGTGTNNSLYTSVGTNLPTGTKVEAWNGTGFSTAAFSAASGSWVPNNQYFTNAVNPGSGFFIQVSAPTNVSFVGRVLTGTNIYNIAAGYQFVSPCAPIPGTLDTTNGYTPSPLDQIQVWNGSGYITKTFSGTTWVGGDPQLALGQSVFLKSVNATNWTEVVNVP